MLKNPSGLYNKLFSLVANKRLFQIYLKLFRRISFPQSSISDYEKLPLNAVFVGCARNASQYINRTLNNIERLSVFYQSVAYVFVENDSIDSTKSDLKKWLRGKRNGHLIELDGMAKNLAARTDRLARSRNAYINFISHSKYKNYHHLVVFDFDDVNAIDIDVESFLGAIRYLESDQNIQGIFANSFPAYYDIWALRHPVWCPLDCWDEVRSCQDLTQDQAVERFVYSRQIPIPSNSLPISVTSAFGGLGIYRLPTAIKGYYIGLTEENHEICEHVSFNSDIVKFGLLYIYPPLRNLAPTEHLGPTMRVLNNPRELSLIQNDKECRLLAPSDHRLDTYRNDNPLYDRRLPLLTKLIGTAEPDKVIIDVGANIGDTVVLCRMAGCCAEIIAIEPSEQYFSFLEANKKALPHFFQRVRTIRAFIGPPGTVLSLIENKGTASVLPNRTDGDFIAGTLSNTPVVSLENITNSPVSLVKIDTDGYDSIILSSSIDFLKLNKPILWVEVDIDDASEEHCWLEILSNLAESYQYICAFDNFGFLIAHGLLSRKLETVLDLISYARRYKLSDPKISGQPRIYYLDLALFPEQYSQLYYLFISKIPELYV